MKTVKFSEAGKWAENDTTLPQFHVKEGEVREVSDELADVIVSSKKGEVVEPKKVTPPADSKAPPAKDKEKAESKAPAKDKAKAE